MTRSRLLTVLCAFIVLAGFAPVASAHYDPGTGRWLERDPIGTRPEGPYGVVRIGQQYRDGMNLYQYAQSQPTIRRDPRGLSSCMDECVSGCPRVKAGQEVWHGNTGHTPTKPHPLCVDRCKILCSCPGDTCTPKGKVVWGTPNTNPGTSGFGLSIQVSGEDPNCCSEFGVVQFVRTTTWPYGTGDWEIDDGRVGWFSDPSPASPYYDNPVPIRNPGGRGIFIFSDEPGGWGRNYFWEFKLLVMCTAGPAAGHIYGMYTWSVGTGGLGGVWSDPSSAPIVPSAIPKELPPILQDRCCDKNGKDT